jgi:hypothetical protein
MLLKGEEVLEIRAMRLCFHFGVSLTFSVASAGRQKRKSEEGNYRKGE